MLKLVSWIDSLPRLSSVRRKSSKCKAKSTASTPLIKHKSQGKASNKKQKKIDAKPPVDSPSTAISNCAIGRRRHTEPDAFRRTRPNSPMDELISSKISNYDPREEDMNFMSVSWHPQGVVERVQSFNARKQANFYDCNTLTCSVHEIGHVNSYTLPTSTNHRPQIRTNPWIGPKSPRVVPALDLRRSSMKKGEKSGSEILAKRMDSAKDDSSVYSLTGSSGYGSGGSQDSSPASSVHTPDWQHLSQRLVMAKLKDPNSEIGPSKEDVALQCDMTEDKSVACTEEDFEQFLHIPMIDDEESDCDEDNHSCYCRSDWHQSDSKNFSKNQSKSTVLNVLRAKVDMLKVNGHQVTQAVRSAKEEQRRRNGELRVYEEQMQFLKQLKLVISNGFEVLV